MDNLMILVHIGRNIYVHVKSRLTPCDPHTVGCQVLLSMEFSRQEYWPRLPFPTPLGIHTHLYTIFKRLELKLISKVVIFNVRDIDYLFLYTLSVMTILYT